MLDFISKFNLIILLLFVSCYFYQMVYVLIYYLKKDPTEGYKAKKLHKFAVIISARNESAVIGELLQSINQQKYPKELLDVYVVADNCTDNTAEIARSYGANVYERFNRQLVGKGYALNYVLNEIKNKRGLESYDGYFVFDADNVLEGDYIAQMNRTFDYGYRVVTSYRNSKNYASSWLSAGYGLWFLRESKYLNGARMRCHSSCTISGTGFLVCSDIIKKNNGWKHHLLTEDIEFSIDNALQGEVIGYCEAATLYDEQPISFHTSWKQRMRWVKGFYQVLANYGGKLAKKCVFAHSFQCYDMLMTIAPATLLTLATIFANSIFALYGLYSGETEIAGYALWQVMQNIAGIYGSLLFFGIITTITEWKNIYCSTPKKICYVVTFPIFVLSYIPISIAALFKPVKWEPITHTISKSVQEIRQ